MSANAGSPKRRETHGDGTAIVVRAGEEVSRYMAKGGREYRRDWQRACDAQLQPQERREIGEPDALKGASPVRGGEVRKGLSSEYSLRGVSLSGKFEEITVPRWPPTPPKCSE
jgi:hypothetical protein